jgi:hypothetical protein
MAFGYQWQRCDASGGNCSSVNAATASTYTLATADVGTTLVVEVTATNGAGSAVAASAATAPVAALAPPTNTAPPTISGAAQVGSVLQASPGTWSGTAPISYSHQWRRCDGAGSTCTSIPGAAAASYVVTLADVGSTVRVATTASNVAGATVATSAHTAVVATAASAPIYWGAWIGNQLTGTWAPWDMRPVTTFEQLAGKQLSTLQFSSPWQKRCSSTWTFYNFDTAAMQNIVNHGAVPFFTWASSASCTSDQSDFQLADVAAGNWDAYVRSWAQAAKNWGRPFFLRFNPEQNGTWTSWSAGVNGNTAADYVAAWRHVHDVFTSVGATNATWVWCPNIDPYHVFTDLRSLYPGDAYVDWTCLDGYNFGMNPAKPGAWLTFDQLYDSTYHEIVDRIAPSKPMVIAEVASSEYGGSKAAWITDMLSTQLPRNYPRVKGVLWFEKFDGSFDWPIETSTAAKEAFAAAIQNPYYATNRFGALPLLTKVPVP